ncbi:MAG: type I glyceraldehyde-3-phosphate dehydrogenase [Bacteroidia bacterium]|nr:type I glyceraldehyde-3-phosphate dehydrogenase [Bacteroidia bacterium]NNF30386.1 type I glyceraldehyde-3-phosphate dehydrogenase [Flavobacteriaceae bacterium]MBT8276462.1 type I glyceraldehyde-3-phosphate dehydrogenase [Bacteroidia bacterium]NNJ80718.1 type I glyceraldehyde-3-phosphate dehydrogenase [Flavobacteriaceae bacterium]NNK53469.1 type I glyceraldehyde-3-phosphate dehydrogenase [Flavobacteriaceae bacterium]
MDKVVNIGINGFGRIGRTLFRKLIDNPNVNVVAINDISDPKTMSHLLKYDSIHGVLPNEIGYNADSIILDENKIFFTSEGNIDAIPWGKLDVVVECTGKFKSKEQLQYHIKNGASRVILAVPPEKDDIKTVVLGVNDQILKPEDHIISNASCTTNNAAPMLQVINELCGIEQAYITTVHSYTTDQSLHDQPHRDLRRARAASQSIVPTTTGAAKALTKIFPELSTVIGGCGIRVPVPNGSLSDITLNVKREVTIEAVNEAFKEASQGSLHGILQYTEDPIVSVDIIGNAYSCIFDSGMTSVIGKMVKIIGWYDNEVGYSSRIVDLILQISRK